MDVTSVYFESAITQKEYLRIQTEIELPADPTYDNRPDPSTTEVSVIYGEPWQLYANCKSQPKLMRDRNEGENYDDHKRRVAEAKKICGECVVRDECLNYALTNMEKHDIWGGYTTEERNKILRARKTT